MENSVYQYVNTIPGESLTSNGTLIRMHGEVFKR